MDSKKAMTDSEISKQLEKGRINPFKILLEITKRIDQFVMSEKEEIIAIFIENGNESILRINDRPFQHWLRANYFRITGNPVTSNQMSEFIETLSSIKYNEIEEKIEFNLRLYGQEDSFLIDLGNKKGEVITINKGRWNVIKSNVRFKQPHTQRKLPYPKQNGDINLLKKYVGLEEKDWFLLLGFILGCYHPKGPYPILILQGGQGTGKSTLSKIIKNIVDPHSILIRSLPKNERDLLIAAQNNHLLIFDNLSGLSSEMSDCLCKLSTGGGFSTKKLYTDTEEVVLTAKNPVILNGIDYIATRDDLIDRSLILELPKIKDINRRDEKTFWDDFNKDLPYILGGIFDVLALIHLNYESIKLPKKPRMADFIQWVTAGESLIGLKENEFLTYYLDNKLEAAQETIENDNLSFGIKTYLEENTRLQGNASHIIKEIIKVLKRKGRDTKENWMYSNKLKDNLDRRKPRLESIGITYEYSRRKERIHTFQRE